MSPLSRSPLHLLLLVTAVFPVAGQSLEERLRALEARVAAMERSAVRETELFEQFSFGVFRVQAGLRDGTGFLVDQPERIVLTNAHVVENATTARVTLVSGQTYPAGIVATSQESDLALLVIHDSVCRGCPGLPLAVSTAGGRLVTGDRVLAMGYPLGNELTMTSGVVSIVRTDAVLSDVNINPGSSGGPLLSMAGEVVGINTFVDQGGVRSGIGGAIGIDRVHTILGELLATADLSMPVSSEPLPTLPERPYPASVLTAVANAAAPQERVYQNFLDIDAGNFTIGFSTPVSHLVIINAIDREVSSERRRREEQAGLPDPLRYSGLPAYRDWYAYVGSLTTPAVVVRITPRFSETTGSVWARILAGPNVGSTYRFEGDLQSATVLRNRVPLEPVRGGVQPIRVDTETRWLNMRDVAYEGVYVFRPDDFVPDAGGVPPIISVAIRDLKQPGGTETVYTINPEIVARIWEDFTAYYASTTNQPVARSTLDLPFESGTPIRIPWSSADVQTALVQALQGRGVQMRQSSLGREGTILWVLSPGDSRASRVSIPISRNETTVWVLGIDEPTQRMLEEIIQTMRPPQ